MMYGFHYSMPGFCSICRPKSEVLLGDFLESTSGINWYNLCMILFTILSLTSSLSSSLLSSSSLVFFIITIVIINVIIAIIIITNNHHITIVIFIILTIIINKFIGIWYKGDFATKMEFKFSANTMTFTLVGIQVLML